MAMESQRKAGLILLWSPQHSTKFLSPAQYWWSDLVCLGSMNESSLAAIKKAGIKALLTWSMGRRVSISKWALLFIVDLKKERAMPTTNQGRLACCLHKSSATSLREAKPESSTSPAIDGSRSACIMAVIAPIDLPHSPIVETILLFLRQSITVHKSSLSYHPNEMYSPSLLPQPEKSKENTWMPQDRSTFIFQMASTLELLLPWRYTTQGSLEHGLFTYQQNEHSRRSPLGLVRDRSCLRTQQGSTQKWEGPRLRSNKYLGQSDRIHLQGAV